MFSADSNMKTKTKVLLIVLAVAVLVLTGYANRLQNARLQKTLAPLSAISELLGITMHICRRRKGIRVQGLR
jgi:hypothetical protein